MRILNVEFELYTITNKTSKANRENYVYRFINNTILTIMLNVHILDEGFDVPECDSVYITQPNDNINNLIQRMCRCNRITSMKNKCNMYLWSDEDKTQKILNYIRDNTYEDISNKINVYNPIRNKLIGANNNVIDDAQVDVIKRNHLWKHYNQKFTTKIHKHIKKEQEIDINDRLVNAEKENKLLREQMITVLIKINSHLLETIKRTDRTGWGRSRN
jgi:superfamily II DNA or RNA helicase